MISKVNETLTVFEGSKKTLVTPSGFSVMIREINGDDEDNLSRLSEAKTGQSIHNFIAGMIVTTDAPNADNGRVTGKQVAEWRSRDKFYVLLNIRVHSFGEKLNFEHLFQDEKEPIAFEEDLTVFNWDFSQGLPPKKGEKGYDPRIPQPYLDQNAWVEGKTASGKIFRFLYLTGKLETEALEKDESAITVNEKLYGRGLEIQMPSGVWVKVENLRAFPARDTMEMRKLVEQLDPAFEGVAEVTHPAKNKRELVSVFQVPDFFYPTV